MTDDFPGTVAFSFVVFTASGDQSYIVNRRDLISAVQVLEALLGTVAHFGRGITAQELREDLGQAPFLEREDIRRLP